MLALADDYREGSFILEEMCGDTRTDFEEVLSLAKQPTSGQKLRLIEAIIPDLEEPLQGAEKGEKPLRSLYGLWKDFGVSISAEEIDAARRELWGNLPQQDT